MHLKKLYILVFLAFSLDASASTYVHRTFINSPYPGGVDVRVGITLGYDAYGNCRYVYTKWKTVKNVQNGTYLEFNNEDFKKVAVRFACARIEYETNAGIKTEKFELIFTDDNEYVTSIPQEGWVKLA